MTRVSENSNTHAVNFAINKAKSRLENLQLKGSNLKAITRPSDNPIANVESLTIDSIQGDNKQYIRNSDFAVLQLNTTEKALEELNDLLMKAKEIAIAQSSDFYDADIRKNVSKEIGQIYNQALTIANKRVGNRYIFAGHSTLKTPFNIYGDYAGDNGHTHLEVAKDFFIPINLHGKEVFFGEDIHKGVNENPVQHLLQQKAAPSEEGSPSELSVDRSIASTNTPGSIEANPKMAKKEVFLPPLEHL